jgi:DNA sulfur modification protein DndB
LISNDRLIVPALKAKMGDNAYYISFLSLKEIAKRVDLAQDIHQTSTLRQLIQRQVTERSKDIGNYLITQPQRFFNALIIGVYLGSPEWYELSIEKSLLLDPEDLPNYMEGALGILVLDGNEKLFAIDGQHRVAGIQHALQQNQTPEGLADEEVCTIFLAANISEQAGLERTRRLFSTLNRYAKPVDMMDIIALDEDDAVAIITRRLMEGYSLFQDHRILVSKGKAIPVTDHESFTTITTLYEVMDIILAHKIGKAWKDFKRFRPADDVLREFETRAKLFWDLMIRHFEPLSMVRDSTQGQGIAGEYRHRGGGHLLFRTVGLLSVTRAIRLGCATGGTLESWITNLARVPLDLNAEPWVGLLWDGVSNRMITRKENQNTAALLLLYMVGADLSQFKTSDDQLRFRYASALNRPVNRTTLPAKII